MKCGRNNLVYIILLIMSMFYKSIIAQYTDPLQKKSNNKNDVYAKAEQSYNNLIKKLNIPVIEIDIDRFSAESIEARIIIDPNKDIDKNKYFLASTYSMIVHKDSLFMLDFKQNAILISNFDGKIIKSIGREGRGPVEFKNPQFISENKNYFFVYDLGNGRIQIFNKKFKYLKSLPTSFFCNGRNLAANNDFLILNEKLTVPFDITSYSLKDLSLRKSNFIKQEFVFETDLKKGNMLYGMVIDASTEKYITAVTSMLPYIFVFDNTGKPIYSIKYKSKQNNENMRSNTSGGYTMLINGIKIIKNNLFVLMPRKMIIYDLQKKAINKILSFDNIGAISFAVYEKTLFLATLDKVYKTDINY